jgi:hypothetical protein
LDVTVRLFMSPSNSLLDVLILLLGSVVESRTPYALGAREQFQRENQYPGYNKSGLVLVVTK